MPARQRIIPVRREYNRWVANQTLEDYALRFTAKSARKFSSSRISQTAIGAISFLALEAIGGTITLAYGTTNAFFAIVVAAILMLLVGVPISRYAIRHGVDIDLLTRGAGFGYIGSTITCWTTCRGCIRRRWRTCACSLRRRCRICGSRWRA